jgi:hypothetical protein
MRIITGFGYDERHPHDIDPRLNTLLCGKDGLLRELEFRAGLVSPTSTKAARIVGYLNALRITDSPTRFYHASFATDPLACAETLLGWRDFAIGHGWKARPGNGSPERLADLAAAELHVADLIPSVAERIEKVMAQSDLIAAVVDEIVLHDAKSLWDAPYQRLFRALQSVGVRITETPPKIAPGAPENTDLGLLQRSLLCGTRQPKPAAFCGDGTLRLYQCTEPHSGASYLCRLLKDQPDHLLIASEQAFLLNNAAISHGFANPGLGESSPWRVPSQLLTLILQCAWSPPRAEPLLQLLTLPTGPFRTLREKLARRFADLPGYDRTVWQHAIDEYVAKTLKDDPKTNETRLRGEIGKWLPIGTAGDAQEMAIEQAIELASQVRAYWQERGGEDLEAAEAKHFLAAYQSADTLAAALRAWGQPRIDQQQLHRLLDIANASSASVHKRCRQVSELNIVESPEGARLSPTAPAHLVWWGIAMRAEERLPPFTPAECSALPEYPHRSALSARRQWMLHRALQPILLAKTSATLIALNDSPDFLRLQLPQHLGDACWHALEPRLIAGQLTEVATQAMADLTLPTEKRWWNLNRPVMFPRAKESYSSLAALALKPHECCLKSAAQLSAGAIIDLPVDARLKGNVSHRIVEAWFQQHAWHGDATPATTIAAWVNEHMQRFIEQFALPLAAPGKRAERLSFQLTIGHAIYRLHQHLAAAGVAKVRIEHRLRRTLPTTELEGIIDILGQLADGRWVVVDMKWASETQRADELKNGQHLQLATYAHLAATLAPGQVADVAYFILRSGNLLCTSQRIFPTARIATPADPTVTTGQVWAAFSKTIDWRCRQLAKGWVEATYGTAAATDESQPSADALCVLSIEAAARQPAWSTWGRATKRINIWRVVSGQFQE